MFEKSEGMESRRMKWPSVNFWRGWFASGAVHSLMQDYIGKEDLMNHRVSGNITVPLAIGILLVVVTWRQKKPTDIETVYGVFGKLKKDYFVEYDADKRLVIVCPKSVPKENGVAVAVWFDEKYNIERVEKGELV